MILHESEKLHSLEDEHLPLLTPVLSGESYRKLRLELKSLKENAPPASGIGIDHPAYIPTTLAECTEKIRRLQERLGYFRQLYFLSELGERDIRRRYILLEKENKKLQEENERLRHDLKKAYNRIQEMLGLKKTGKDKKASEEEEGTDQSSSEKKRGAPKGHRGQTRPVPEIIDAREILPPPEKCPECHGTVILPGMTYISKYVEDIAPIVKHTTEKRFLKGTCAHCHELVVSPEATEGPAVIIGDNLIALLSIMRQQMGVSLRKLSRFSSETLHIPLSPSGVLGILNRVSRKLEPIYKGIEGALRAQPVLYGDETGWHMDGRPWYLWCVCNKEIVYFHADQSRGSKVLKALIGEDYSGIFHADFYGAYNFITKKQRCLVHLIRDIKEELEVTPGDDILNQLEKELHEIIEKGLEIKVLHDSPVKTMELNDLEKRLNCLTKLTSENKRTNTLIKRIITHKNDLLRFAAHEEVEYHNNRAERTIRTAVIFRKLSFGNRTPQGAYYFTVLLSVLETCRKKGEVLTVFLKNVLTTPENQLHYITKSLFDSS